MKQREEIVYVFRKKTLNLLYILDVISVIALIAFLIGPDFLRGTSVAEFMLKHRGLMIYHCIVFALLTGLFRKLHAEITMEIKWLQNWISTIEKKAEE